MRLTSPLLGLAWLTTLAAAEPYSTDLVRWAGGYDLLDRPVVQFALGSQNVVAIQDDGSVVGWGNNSGAFYGKRVFAKPAVKVAVGDLHAYAILADSSLVDLKPGDYRWTVPADLGKVLEVSIYPQNAVALRSDGSLRFWGPDSALSEPPAGLKGLHKITGWYRGAMAIDRNDSLIRITQGVVIPQNQGQVLDYTFYATLHRDGKVDEGGFPRTDSATAIASGKDFTVALRSQGRLLAWGDNTLGQCDVPNTSGIQAIAANGSLGMALLADGHLVAWGYDTTGRMQIPTLPQRVTALSAGTHHALALLPDSTVVSWNDGWMPDVRQIPKDLKSVVDIAAGYDFSAALRRDGQVVVWGRKTSPALVLPNGLSDVTNIDVNEWAIAAVKRDGSVVIWGQKFGGDTAYYHPGAEIQNLEAVALGNTYGVGLTKAGQVLAWGTGCVVDSLPKNLTGAQKIWTNGEHSAFALDAERRLIGWGCAGDSILPVPPDLGPVKNLSVSRRRVIAQRGDGTLRTWGQVANSYGTDTIPTNLGPVAAFSLLGRGVVAVRATPTTLLRTTAPTKSVARLGDRILLTEPGTVTVYSATGQRLQTVIVGSQAVAIGPGLPLGLLVVRQTTSATASFRWIHTGH